MRYGNGRIKNRLLEEYKYRFELHAHSNPASSCSEFPCSEFIKNLIDDGLDGVALPKDSYDIAELIKSQDFIFEIGGSIIIP